MTRVIPQEASTDPVDLDHLLAVFIPDEDDPISHSVADVLAAADAQALIVPRFVSGQAYARGQLASDSTDKIYVCI